jgi:hypothetical protein
VRETKKEQPLRQCERIIGRLSDLNGGLGVANCLVEPAELGEYVSEAGS